MTQSVPASVDERGTRRNPLLLRLWRLAGLGSADLAAIERLFGVPRTARARDEIVGEGEGPDRLHVLTDGWACRVRLLADGKRQITALLLPGDICNPGALSLDVPHVTVTALTPCTIVPIERAALVALQAANQRIATTLGWLAAVENAMMAERVACIGRRSARDHLAHLFCELLVRLTVVGQAKVNGFTLPITQEEIGDVLGITAVHVNRVLHSLRAEGLIEQQGRHVIVREWAVLRQVAGFEPGYLHLEGIDGAGHVPMVAPSASPARHDGYGGDAAHL